MSIKDNYLKIRREIPENVKIVLAAKKRTVEEIKEVIDAGATDLGENYVQEFEAMYNALGDYNKKVKWHMIGSIQKNKINKLLPIVDVVQTIDSFEKAVAINKRAERINKIIEALIEINIGSEITKSGLPPEYDVVEDVVKKMAELKFIKVKGLMTMGPRSGNPEDSRIYFKKTK
ncbi:MAG: YggS family pyridoxal phosphate-dependent enzyme, partial [Bacteroidales bacterium]|nr:YggS family pyridoxal phosphate-dependent enzyme [Bacteroidales bacterium]